LWCRRITSEFPFLLPFDMRRLHWACTGLGIARALQAIQEEHANDAADRPDSFRIGRIQRQKVCLQAH